MIGALKGVITAIGEDAALDAARFTRTDGGVVLVTRQMLADLEAALSA